MKELKTEIEWPNRSSYPVVFIILLSSCVFTLPNFSSPINSLTTINDLLLSRSCSEKAEKRYNTINTTYLKLSHFGNSPIIMDCKVIVEYKNKGGNTFELKENIGVIEQGIEVFVPIVTLNAKVNESLTVKVIKLEYKTLMNETIRYVINHITYKEYYCVVNVNGNEDKIYEQEITSSSWTYPNKIKQM
ncbi:hypothetical protein [Peribacillus simplex]|uniref:Uncharacterized protein n=1 Tax=Peribacillus simplex TaxID=1478 RepID=A0AAN2PCF6_9BACI|nr:hypothetical protein [Peribacillus simplex]CEG30032.1 hypothetical protein BN1180_00127 [Peribacillus simplex]